MVFSIQRSIRLDALDQLTDTPIGVCLPACKNGFGPGFLYHTVRETQCKAVRPGDAASLMLINPSPVCPLANSGSKPTPESEMQGSISCE